jgi:hypothetical protein
MSLHRTVDAIKFHRWLLHQRQEKASDQKQKAPRKRWMS